MLCCLRYIVLMYFKLDLSGVDAAFASMPALTERDVNTNFPGISGLPVLDSNTTKGLGIEIVNPTTIKKIFQWTLQHIVCCWV